MKRSELSEYRVPDPNAPPTILLGDKSKDRFGLTAEARRRMSRQEFEQMITCDAMDGVGPLADLYRACVDKMDCSEFYRAIHAEGAWFERWQSDVDAPQEDENYSFRDYQQKHSPSSNLNR